jgi:hypothetical protein
MNENNDTEIRLNEEFKPDKDLKKVYYIYAIIIVAVSCFSWSIPLIFFTDLWISLYINIPIVLVLILILIWIPKYYNSISYKIDDEDLEYNRGVWFKNTGIVPYSKITNIDISQGPVARHYGFASLKIHTAGYSAQSRSEIKLSGIIEYEKLKKLIMDKVREHKKTPPEIPEEEEKINQKILDEIIKIRKLMEKA